MNLISESNAAFVLLDFFVIALLRYQTVELCVFNKVQLL